MRILGFIYASVLTLFCVGLLLGFLAGRASAQHAEHHDAYKSLTNPTTSVNCCNDRDCRPGNVWRDAAGNIVARVEGREMSVPEAALLPDGMNPHPPVGMICERDGRFYCVAFSGAGG